MMLLLFFLYICVGALVTFALYSLYIRADRANCGWNDQSYYCVIIGVLWPVAAPFAFAVFFAKYGKDKKRNEV